MTGDIMKLLLRANDRRAGVDLGPPDDGEKRAAIRLLDMISKTDRVAMTPGLQTVFVEAQHVLDDASV